MIKNRLFNRNSLSIGFALGLIGVKTRRTDILPSKENELTSLVS